MRDFFFLSEYQSCIYLVITCFAHRCDQSWEIFTFGIKSSKAVPRTYWLVWLIMPVHLVFDTPTYSCMTFEGLLRWGPYVYNQLRMSQKSQQPFKLWAEIHQHTFNAPTLVCCAWGENLAPAELLGSSSWAIEIVGSYSERAKRTCGTSFKYQKWWPSYVASLLSEQWGQRNFEIAFFLKDICQTLSHFIDQIKNFTCLVSKKIAKLVRFPV